MAIGKPKIIDRLDGHDIQLADNMKQMDFVKMIQKHNNINNSIFVRILGDRNFEVLLPFKGTKATQYVFNKDTLDDYIRFFRGSIATLTTENNKKTSSNYDSKTGNWVVTSPPSYYTQEVGATMTISFNGTGIYFQHVADNRGGIWEFVFDGDTTNKVTISTYNSTTTTKKTLVKNNLVSGSHIAIATFKGDDPLNAPSSGVGTARGWAYFSNGVVGKETFDVYDNITYPIFNYDVYAPASNIEFAIGMKPKDSAYTEYFVPEHGTGTAFAEKQEIYFDDQLITSWTAETTVREIKKVTIYQELLAKHPSTPLTPMAKIYSLHTITANGVEFFTKIKYLTDVTCTDGYAMMLPCDNTFATKLISSLGNVYDATKRDDSNTNLSENNNGISFAFLNENGALNRPNIVMAMTINNPYKTLRMGKDGIRNPLLWLQHRSTTMQKLYPQVFKNSIMLNGDSDEFSGSLFIGELQNAFNLLC